MVIPNSWRALRGDLTIFAAWCASEREAPFPAGPEAIARFIAAQAELGKKVVTLSRYASSIAQARRLARLIEPCRHERVRLELKAQRRALGVRQRQARGLRFRGEVGDPLAATPVAVCLEAMLGAAPEILPGWRNWALLSLAFDTGPRRSEIVAVCWHHIESGSAGAGRLFVPRLKSDQEGAGTYAFLSVRTMVALGAWKIDCGGEGAVFRRLHRKRRRDGSDVWTVGAALSAQSVTLAYRAMLNGAWAGGSRHCPRPNSMTGGGP